MNASRGQGWGSFRRRVAAAAAFLASGLVCGVAWGHVAFTAPAPNAQVVAGSTTELTWVDTISHQTTSYEIEFFPAADAASVVVAANIPPSQHSWSWQVPAQPCMGCFLVVTQHNVDSSYSDSLALAIVAGSAMGASGSTSSPPASEQPASCALGSPGSAPVGSAAWLVCMGVAAGGLRRRRVR